MDFVDDVDLVACLNRGIAHAFDQFAHLADAGAARCIHLDDVHVTVVGNRQTVPALAAGHGRGPALAVRADAIEGAGKNAGRRRLPDPAHAGQHIALGQAPAGDGIGQSLNQGILADHVGEGRRPVFTRQDAIRRGCGCYFCHPGADGGTVGARTATRMETRYGCFLPDLPGLARHTSAASLPPSISGLNGGHARANQDARAGCREAPRRVSSSGRPGRVPPSRSRPADRGDTGANPGPHTSGSGRRSIAPARSCRGAQAAGRSGSAPPRRALARSSASMM